MLTPWDPAEMRTDFCGVAVVVGAPLQVPLSGLFFLPLLEQSVAVVKQHLETWLESLGRKPFLCVKGQSVAKLLLCNRRSQLFRGCNSKQSFAAVSTHRNLAPLFVHTHAPSPRFPLSQETSALTFLGCPCLSVPLSGSSKEGPDMTLLSLTHLSKTSTNLTLPSLQPAWPTPQTPLPSQNQGLPQLSAAVWRVPQPVWGEKMGNVI